ncbi:FAR1 domain-containing protein [Plasmodiophora brassicae]|uniref:Uncharacterized protein n=1 Tax=Plasmodiophora brassicae TaxID=37360 RepID=A0A3P3Y8Y3_PLABS|nr:unnamed protein product [Plasmodiophora brassicae]
MAFDTQAEMKHFLETYAKKTGFHFKPFAEKERSIDCLATTAPGREANRTAISTIQTRRRIVTFEQLAR